MKPPVIILSILFVAAAAFAIGKCQSEKGPASKIGNKLDDALDARPAEGLRDAVERVTK